MTNKPQFVGEKVRLGELIKSSGARNRDGNYADVYSVTNSKGFIPSEEYFSKEVYSKELSAYKLVSRNMIAYNPSRINVGSVGVQDKANTAIVSPLYVVFSTDATRLIPAYLVRFLKSKSGLNQIAFQSIGTVRNNLKFDALCRMEIVLPSLETQNERLGLLGLIEDKIDLCNQQIAALSDLVKSRFVEMFGDPIENPFDWRTKPLSNLGNLKNGVNFKSVDSGTEIRCLSVSDFKDRYQISNMELISSVSLNNKPNKSQLLRDGDVVFVRSNGNKRLVGRCLAIFPGDEDVTFSGFCIRFRNESNELLFDYLLGCLKSDSMRKAMTGRGANIQNLSQKILSEVVLPIPPLTLQQEFATFVQHVDKSRFIAQQQIEKLQMLYDSLAQEYFGD